MTKTYPNNLTWEQWELIANLFPETKPGGRPRKVSIYAVVNAIMYVLCQGCTWRALPGDFPAWQTVYGYFRRWQKDDIATAKEVRTLLIAESLELTWFLLSTQHGLNAPLPL